jgi:hypothetical protein
MFTTESQIEIVGKDLENKWIVKIDDKLLKKLKNLAEKEKIDFWQDEELENM